MKRQSLLANIIALTLGILLLIASAALSALGQAGTSTIRGTVTDPQGYDTTVAVYNLDSNKKLDSGLFKIDFTNYALPPG